LENQEQLKQILVGCVNQKRRSQEELFKLYYGKMLSVVHRYIHDIDTSQEVVQEGFIKVFDKLHKFDFKGSFEGWIRRIMTNCAIDHIRKAKRNPFLSEKDEDFKVEIEDQLILQEDLELSEIKYELALESISELSPAYRTVFNLFAVENYTHREIAEMLNISEGTSKSNYAKAKMNLQKILKSKLKSE
jgi:RNA polymerase sigma-70 factor (ECF subfamily)